MTIERQTMQDLAQDVAGLKVNVELLTKLGEKTDSTLEKMQEVAQQTAKILAVHEERMEYQKTDLDHHKNNDETKFENLTSKVEAVVSKVDKVKSELETSFQRQIEPLKRALWMTMGAGFVIMTLIEIVGILWRGH